MRTVKKLWILLAGTLILASPGLSLADDDSTDSGLVKVYVRTIQANESLSGAGEHSDISLDSALEDLKPKLEKLPFKDFRLLGSREEQLSLKKKDVITLPNGQSLAFRPIYMEKKRVGLWLSWKESNGASILNTRVHFDSDDCVLTGTDSGSDSGLILAIKASPVPLP